MIRGGLLKMCSKGVTLNNFSVLRNVLFNELIIYIVNCHVLSLIFFFYRLNYYVYKFQSCFVMFDVIIVSLLK